MLSSQDKAVDRVLESVLNILVSNRQGGHLCSEDACASAIRTRASSEGGILVSNRQGVHLCSEDAWAMYMTEISAELRALDRCVDRGWGDRVGGEGVLIGVSEDGLTGCIDRGVSEGVCVDKVYGQSALIECVTRVH